MNVIVNAILYNMNDKLVKVHILGKDSKTSFSFFEIFEACSAI